ncbi:MAG TPA: hypothetical protein GX510_07430 [Firmicutes bacterium]|nr:hypothetical protein [Candidatus Fermentithermobacillaceae bacterium]
MDKVSQVRSVLLSLKSMIENSLLTGMYRGIEKQAADMYGKCIAMLKTEPGYENIEELLPALPDEPTLAQVGFAVGVFLGLLRQPGEPGRKSVLITTGARGSGGITVDVGSNYAEARRILDKIKSFQQTKEDLRTQLNESLAKLEEELNERIRRRLQEGSLDESADELEEEIDEALEQAEEDWENKLEELENEIEELENEIEELENQVESLSDKVEEIGDDLSEKLEEVRERIREKWRL